MSPLGLLEAAPPGAALWSLLIATAVYALVTAQPLGQPKPDLAERLARLDVDERIRMGPAGEPGRPFFASRALEALLRPMLDDVGRLARALLSRVGLAGGDDLAARLRLTRPGVDVAQFFGEKTALGLLGLGLLPLMNVLGAHLFGSWPVWSWAVGFAVGFLAPDVDLEHRVRAHRTACLMELPTVLDLLAIGTSAGLALEQALAHVAERSRGVVGRELRLVGREVALGQRTLVGALGAMSERNAVPELVRFADQLRSAHEQGVPLTEALAAQADALRQQKRLRIVEEGGKATVRMVVPVALFILPSLFVVLLVPAASQVLSLGG